MDVPQIPPADLSGIDEELYREFGRKVDSIGTGYPPTKSGQELLYWSALYNPDEARTYINMEDAWQTPEEYAEANDIPLEEAQAMLVSMAKKALIYREKLDDGEYHYRPIPFAHGINEFQFALYSKGVTDVNPLPFAQMGMAEGMFFGQFTLGPDPLYHVVPYHKEMVVGGEVVPTDDLQAILDSKSRFALTNCTCRAAGDKKSDECTHPIETCIACDAMADFYLETGIGRAITREDAERILAEGDADGRFVQVFNNQESNIICSCCGCGCGILKFPQIFPGNCVKHWTNYPAVMTRPEDCIGCGACVEACAMHTLEMVDGRPQDVRDICVGCGQCIKACPKHTRDLVRRPDDELYTPPATMWEQNDNSRDAIAAIKKQMAATSDPA